MKATSRRDFLRLAGAGVLVLPWLGQSAGVGFPVDAPAAAGPTAKPNILIILADDLGYGDVQCYNPQRGKIPTPCMDRLASQGMRFTDGHSSSGVCSPSRYTLLTGRYHWRTRLQAGSCTSPTAQPWATRIGSRQT